MAIKDHRMMLGRTLSATLLAVTFSLFGTSAFAVTYTIDHRFDTTDNGFEDPVPPRLPEGNDPRDHQSLGNEWYSYLPNGWTQSDTYYYGQYDETGIHYDDGLDRGQVSEFLLDLVNGDPVYPVGMEKTLDGRDGGDVVILEANKRYELSVAVGNPRSVPNGYDLREFGGYKIELLAGGEWLADDDNGNTIAEGAFVTSESISFVAGDAHAGLLGAALGIRLIHKNVGVNPEDPTVTDPLPVITWAIGFDDVQLTVSAVPVPAAVWLFGTALVGLFGFGKRRKTAQPA